MGPDEIRDKRNFLCVSVSLWHVEVTRLRLSSLCGPGDTHNSAGPNLFMRTAVADGRIKLFGECEEQWDHVALLVSDYIEGAPVSWLTIFWTGYDRVQQPVCLEGQELAFVTRERASALKVPEHLVRVWDSALAAQKNVMTSP